MQSGTIINTTLLIRNWDIGWYCHSPSTKYSARSHSQDTITLITARKRTALRDKCVKNWLITGTNEKNLVLVHRKCHYEVALRTKRSPGLIKINAQNYYEMRRHERKDSACQQTLETSFFLFLALIPGWIVPLFFSSRQLGSYDCFIFESCTLLLPRIQIVRSPFLMSLLPVLVYV